MKVLPVELYWAARYVTVRGWGERLIDYPAQGNPFINNKRVLLCNVIVIYIVMMWIYREYMARFCFVHVCTINLCPEKMQGPFHCYCWYIDEKTVLAFPGSVVRRIKWKHTERRNRHFSALWPQFIGRLISIFLRQQQSLLRFFVHNNVTPRTHSSNELIAFKVVVGTRTACVKY